MPASFFVQAGYSPTTQSTFDQLVEDAIAAAGAIGPKSVTVVNPTGAEDLVLFYVNAEVTVQQITASVRGSTPSINASLGYTSTPNGVLTELVTGGITVTAEEIATTFDNATIPADCYVRLVTSAKSGAVDELAISIDF